jgi:hypothetical protein
VDNADVFYMVRTAEAWSEPTDVSAAPRWDWGPSIAALPNGEVHVVWQNAQGAFETNVKGYRVQGVNPVLWHRVCRKGEWAPASAITAKDYTFGALAVDPKGGLYLAYLVGGLPQNSIRLSRWTDGAWAGSEPVGAASRVSVHVPVSLAVDGQGGIHVAYTALGATKVTYVRKGEAGWLDPLEVGDLTTGGPYALVGGPDGTVHMVYPEKAGIARACLAYTCFRDGQWTEPVAAIAECPQTVAMAADKEGVVHLVWGMHGQFYHGFLKGGQWQLGAQG